MLFGFRLCCVVCGGLCSIMKCYEVLCSAVQLFVALCNVVKCGAVLWSVGQFFFSSVVQCCTV